MADLFKRLMAGETVHAVFSDNDFCQSIKAEGTVEDDTFFVRVVVHTNSYGDMSTSYNYPITEEDCIVWEKDLKEVERGEQCSIYAL